MPATNAADLVKVLHNGQWVQAHMVEAHIDRTEDDGIWAKVNNTVRYFSTGFYALVF